MCFILSYQQLLRQPWPGGGHITTFSTFVCKI
jgi:hypothetical protein